jgi:flagellar hook-basal body complex protein FliE
MVMIDKVNLISPLKQIMTKANETVSGEGGADFASFFQNALQEVNKLQLDADAANVKLAAGKIEDIAPVVIATEKASIALQLTVQVRNKIVEAYNDVMRMQV